MDESKSLSVCVHCAARRDWIVSILLRNTQSSRHVWALVVAAAAAEVHQQQQAGERASERAPLQPAAGRQKQSMSAPNGILAQWKTNDVVARNELAITSNKSSTTSNDDDDDDDPESKLNSNPTPHSNSDSNSHSGAADLASIITRIQYPMSLTEAGRASAHLGFNRLAIQLNQFHHHQSLARSLIHSCFISNLLLEAANEPTKSLECVSNSTEKLRDDDDYDHRRSAEVMHRGQRGWLPVGQILSQPGNCWLVRNQQVGQVRTKEIRAIAARYTRRVIT